MAIRDILQRREAIRVEMRALVGSAPDGNLPDDKAARFTALEAEATNLNAAEQRQATIDGLARAAGGAPATESPEAEGVTAVGLKREQRFADYVTRSTGIPTANLSAGRAIRGMVCGKWNGSEAEQRVMAGITGSAGGFLLPSPVSASIIDLVRNRCVLLNAGALTIPMDTATLRVVQVISDPVANVRQEGDAITETDGSFAAVTLQARSVGALVTISRELMDDAPAFAAELEHQLSMVLALKLDALGLYGTGASNQPLGLRNTSGLQQVSMGTNGANFSTTAPYSQILTLLQDLEQANCVPDSLVYAPRTKYELAGMQDTLNRYFNASCIPDSVNALRKLTSNQISVTETQGTASTASTLFAGDFSNCAFGIRQDLTIETSFEAGTAFAQNQVVVRALLRADFVCLRPALIGRLVGIL